MDFRTIGPDGSVTSWWKVDPAYDFAEDCQTGREYAEQYATALIRGEVTNGLQHIVAGFPYKWTGIEVGFLHGINERIV